MLIATDPAEVQVGISFVRNMHFYRDAIKAGLYWVAVQVCYILITTTQAHDCLQNIITLHQS